MAKKENSASHFLEGAVSFFLLPYNILFTAASYHVIH